MMQHSARSTKRQEKNKQIHFIVNGAKRSTFLAIATESTYLTCLGHFENASQLVERKKSTIRVLQRDNLAISTLWWSSHWKIHRGWSQHRRFLRQALKNISLELAVPPDGIKLAYEFLRMSASNSVLNRRGVSWIPLASYVEHWKKKKTFRAGTYNQVEQTLEDRRGWSQHRRCLKHVHETNVPDLLLSPLTKKTFLRDLLDTFHKLLLGLRDGDVKHVFNGALLRTLKTPWLRSDLFLMDLLVNGRSGLCPRSVNSS